MPSSLARWSLYAGMLLGLSLVYLIAVGTPLPDIAALAESAGVQSFKTMFISIVLEAIPFILVGVILSALLQTFVSAQTIARFVPKHPVPGILYACVMGILFPICECGMIPVMRRLLRKGMPLYIAVVFITAGPILNPVVFASTFMAFRSRPEIAWSRMGLAFVCAAAIGLIICKFVRKNPLRGAGNPAHVHDHPHHHGGKWNTMLTHASDEFFEMGKYLLFGALLAAGIQAGFSRDLLVSIGTGAYSSHLFMMGFAYIISLCSTSDAFVASSFVSTFSAGSILSFLVFGPMLDFKGTLMLLAIFRARFVILLSMLIFLVVLAASLLLENLGFFL